jgi:hypothetical protein
MMKNRGRTVVSVALAWALLLSLASASLAQTGDTVGGTFTLANAAPTITSVEVIPAGGGSAVTSMTPGTAYKAKIVANDANTVDDITQVRVALVFDSGDSDPTTDPGETGDTHTLAALKWVKSGDSWSISPTGGSPATTWSITPASSVKPSDMTLTTGTWEFYFTVGKVATVADGGTGQDGWDLFGEVKDEASPVESWDDRDLAMEWYGEIDITTASVNWGSVSPGMDFAEGSPSEESGISVTYVANGPYDEQVAASGTWDDGGTNTADLDNAGSPEPNEFSLKADENGTLASAVLLDASPTYVTIDASGTQTDDDGDPVATNSLFMKLGTPFLDAVYSGTVYFKIAEGS